LAERERKGTPPFGGVFVARNQVLDAAGVARAVKRMAHEVVERNSGLTDVIIIGLQTGGVPFAEAMAQALLSIENVEVPVGKLDVALYRDDINLRPVLPEAVTEVPFDLRKKVVVLVDDVLFTGRTIRAALDAIIDHGRPRAIQLAVMVDRGHRELPIRPDFVGKNLPTRRDEAVNATLDDLLNQTDRFAEVQQRAIRKVPALRGKTVVMAFFEDSTRTRSSFDLAARRLSADVVTFRAGSSSVNKGESLRDTVETISAMGIDGIVVRHSSPGVARQLTNWTDASIINAGDGQHQHPTQALLDCYTIRQKRGDLLGKRIAIVGDINHSRVARSNVAAFTKLGAEVVLVAPPTLLPASLDGWPVKVEPDLDSIIGDIDIVYLLRIQTERMKEAMLPSDREYRSRWGLTLERARRLSPEALIMHPGPMNRGVEIDPEVADDSRSVILDQVANGLPVRMAVLFRVLGAGQFEEQDNGAQTSGGRR